MIATDQQLTQKEIKLNDTQALSIKMKLFTNLQADIDSTNQIIKELNVEIQSERSSLSEGDSTPVGTDEPAVTEDTVDIEPALTEKEKQLNKLKDKQANYEKQKDDLTSTQTNTRLLLTGLQNEQKTLVEVRYQQNDQLNIFLSQSDDETIKVLFEQKNMFDTLLENFKNEKSPVDAAIQELKDVQKSQTEALNKQQIQESTLQSLKSELETAQQQFDDLSAITAFKDKAVQGSDIAKKGAFQNIGMVALTTSLGNELPLVDQDVISDFTPQDRLVQTETFNGLIQDLESAINTETVPPETKAFWIR